MHGIGVGAAQQHTDPLARLHGDAPAQQCGKGSSAARLGDDTQPPPQRLLRRDDGLIADQRDVINVALGEREHQRADLSRCQRVRRDTARRRLDRFGILSSDELSDGVHERWAASDPWILWHAFALTAWCESNLGDGPDALRDILTSSMKPTRAPHLDRGAVA